MIPRVINNKKTHFTQNKYTDVPVCSCQKANVTQTHKLHKCTLHGKGMGYKSILL